jgi:hypothetical protein
MNRYDDQNVSLRGGVSKNGHKVKMGRPVIEIDFKLFESLCEIQCTLNEIAGVLKVSADTVERRCKEQYGETFADCYKKLSAPGLMSLRRAQMKTALDGNATMQIWLGKQLLGQNDKLTIDVNKLDSDIERELAAITSRSQTALAGEAESESIN